MRGYLGLQITRDRARHTITLTQSHMVHQVLQRFGFQFSLPQPTPLSTSHSLSAPPSDESVEPSGPYPELVGCLMYVMTCTRPDLAYPLSLLARYVAPGRHRKVHWDAAKRVLRYLCSTSGLGLVLGGWGPVVLTGHADASWELRWLTYLLTDLGEQPRLPPILYVDNKAMIALCQEYRLEHRTKHIALRYFLAQELQQRGQLCLAYVATRANTADVFTKALPPGDHQRFATLLGLRQRAPYSLARARPTALLLSALLPCLSATLRAHALHAHPAAHSVSAPCCPAGSGGAECPLGTGGTGGAGAGGPGSATGGTGVASAGGTGARRQETFSPERLCEWAVQWGSPGGGAIRARTTRAGGAGATGAVGGTGGAAAGNPGSRRQEPLSQERLREWAVRWGSPGGGAARYGGAGPGGASAGVPGVECARGTGTGGTGAAGGTAGAGAAEGSRGAGPGGASAGVPGISHTGGTGTRGIGAAGGTGGADTGGTTGGTGLSGASRQELLSPLQLRKWAVRWGSPGGGAGGTGYGGAVASGAGGSGVPVAGTTPPLLFPPPDQSQPELLPGSPLPAPSSHTERVVLPSPPTSSLPHVPDPESDLVRAASPTVTRLLAMVVTDPSFEFSAESALVVELVDFAALCRLDYAASLVFYSSCPATVGGELALGCDVLNDRQFELECLAAAAPHLASTLLCPEGDPDALDIPTQRSYA
ncbi:unnamed protein product [Closterium sp. NIES-54]